MIDELYKQQILNLAKAPAHKESLEESKETVKGRNPLCGDEIILDHRHARFDGYACALCTASAEILCTLLEDPEAPRRSLKESDTRRWAVLVLEILSSPAHPGWEEEGWELLKPLLTAHHFPSRLECIYLPWRILSAEEVKGID